MNNSTQTGSTGWVDHHKDVSGHTGIRGIAAVVVLLFHLRLHYWLPEITACHFITSLANWPNGAVDLFFMLSGFVLCHVYSDRKLNWVRFYTARFARITPLATATLLACITIDLYSWSRHGIWSHNLDLGRITANLFLIQAFWGNAVENSINIPSWSVSVEAFLYLAVFSVLVKINKGGLFWQSIGFASMLGLILSYSEHCPVPNWMIRGVLGFTIGFALRRLSFPEEWRTLISICGSASFLAVFVFSLYGISSPAIHTPLLIVILAASARNELFISRILSTKLFIWLGERSYSIYLIHHILIIFWHRLLLYPNQIDGRYSFGVRLITYTLIVASTFIAGHASYAWFEIPLRNWIRKVGRV